MPLFSGFEADDLKNLLIQCELPENGKVTLYDGRNGEAFANDVTV